MGDLSEEQESERESLSVFEEIKKAIDEDRYSDAESLLDNIEERGGEWYFYRAMLCKKRSWFLEASRNLKEAIALDSENELYKKELAALEEMTVAGESDAADGSGKKKRKKRKINMGTKESWNDACGECMLEGCCACLCEGICEGLCEGCS